MAELFDAIIFSNIHTYREESGFCIQNVNKKGSKMKYINKFNFQTTDESFCKGTEVRIKIY